jgi:hypothetical protein
VDGTAPVIYTVEPPLPAGMSLDRESGVVTGVPEAATPLRTYTVKVANRVGAHTAEVAIEVLEPPSELRPSRKETLFPTRAPIRPIRMSIRGTRDAACGKMTFSAGKDPEQARRTFEEYDQDGSGILDEAEMAEMLLGMGVAATEAEIGEIMAEMEGMDGEAGISFDDFWQYFSAGLPKGLSIDRDDGTISGTPEAEARPGIYVITAHNPVGEFSCSVKIEIQVPLPPTPPYCCP